MSQKNCLRTATRLLAGRSLTLCLALLCPGALKATEPKTVTLNIPSAETTAFDGWGTSLCWFANAIGRWPEPVREEIADALFSERGLGLTVVRYNIGGGEAPGHHHMPWFRQMEGFLDDSGQWNWERDPGQRWMLHAAIKRGACRLEAFSNSPPYWMTLSGCASGGADKNKDNLDPAKEAAFAAYLAEVVKHFRDVESVRFDTLDPMNEPWTDYWGAQGSQEGCHFDHASQASLLSRLRATLDKEGLGGVALSASDETNYEKAAESWKAYDAATRACVAQVNSHSYETKGREELRALIAASGKPLVMSEVDHGGGNPHDHQSMKPALVLASHIVEDLRGLRPLRWVFWQAVEDEQGQAGSDNNWGLIHADLAGGSHAWVRTKKYHAFAQFTRHLRPGAVILPDTPGGMVVALDRKQHRLVIIACNRTAEEQGIRLDLRAFGVKGAAAKATRTSSTEDQAELPDLRVSDGLLDYRTLPSSVSTIEIPIGSP